MKALPPITAEMADLLESLFLDELTPADARRLEHLVQTDDDACRHYVLFTHMHAIAERYQGVSATTEARLLDERLPVPVGVSSALPMIGVPATTFPLVGEPPRGMLGGFAESPPFAYLVASVLIAIGLLIGSWVGVSGPLDIADNGGRSTPQRSTSSDDSVGRITGMVGCRFRDPTTGTVVGAPVSLHRNYAILTGLLEITYDMGATVVVRGPATYTVESNDSGRLTLGRLVAKVETKGEATGGRGAEMASNEKAHKDPPSANPQSPIPNPSSPRFTITTPTATVTDLGTEFGVDVADNGDCEVHVLQGVVEMQTAGPASGDSETVRLTEGQAGRCRRAEHHLAEIPSDVAKFRMLHIAKLSERYEQWQAFSRRLQADPSLLAYYAFERRQTGSASVLPNLSALRSLLDGEIQNAAWSRGRFPGKPALAFRGEGYGDRVVLPEPNRFSFSGPFTVAVWFKSYPFSTGHDALIAKGDTSWRLQQARETRALSLDTTLPAIARDPVPKVLDLSHAACKASGVYEDLAERAASLAFDVDRQSCWASSFRFPAWIWVDLGADMDIKSLKIDWENSYATDYQIGVRTAVQGPADWPTSYQPVALIRGRDVGLASSPLVPGNLGNWDDTLDFGSGTVTFEFGKAESTRVSTNVMGRYLMLSSTAAKNGICCAGEIQIEASPSPERSVAAMEGRTTVDDGRWHLAVAVYEPQGNTAKKRLYIDGRLDAEVACPADFNQNSEPVCLGGNSQAPWDYRGCIDEVAIFTRVMSPEEIGEMFEIGNPAMPRRGRPAGRTQADN